MPDRVREWRVGVRTTAPADRGGGGLDVGEGGGRGHSRLIVRRSMQSQPASGSRVGELGFVSQADAGR